MKLTETEKQTLIVGSILGGAVLIIIVYVGLMFVNPSIDEANEEIDSLKTEIAKNEKKLNEYKAYLENDESRRKVEEAFGRIRRRLPEVSDPIEVIDILRDYIEGTDVTFTFLDSQRTNRRPRYIEYPFTIRGAARYHQFGQLLNLVECNPDRLMRVTEFRLRNNEVRPSFHPMELSIETYTFSETVSN